MGGVHHCHHSYRQQCFWSLTSSTSGENRQHYHRPSRALYLLKRRTAIPTSSALRKICIPSNSFDPNKSIKTRFMMAWFFSSKFSADRISLLRCNPRSAVWPAGCRSRPFVLCRLCWAIIHYSIYNNEIQLSVPRDYQQRLWQNTVTKFKWNSSTPI